MKTDRRFDLDLQWRHDGNHFVIPPSCVIAISMASECLHLNAGLYYDFWKVHEYTKAVTQVKIHKEQSPGIFGKGTTILWGWTEVYKQHQWTRPPRFDRVNHWTKSIFFSMFVGYLEIQKKIIAVIWFTKLDGNMCLCSYCLAIHVCGNRCCTCCHFGETGMPVSTESLSQSLPVCISVSRLSLDI